MRLTIIFLLISVLLSGCSVFANPGMSGVLLDPLPPTLDPSVLTPGPTPTPDFKLEAHSVEAEFTEVAAEGTPTISPNQTKLPPSPTPILDTFGPFSFPDGMNPLTGTFVDDPALLERRPIVIKVTNFPRSVRPQWGLSAADHVYEYYIADEMSRFVGIFYGQDAERVGPIRSARLFDEEIMRAYSGIFVFGWADDPILDVLLVPDLKNHLIVDNGDNCPPLCRIGPKTAYNNLYADTSKIAPYLEWRRNNNDRQELLGLHFEPAVPQSGNPGKQVFIQYSLVSYHSWEYDPASGKYLRFQDTRNALDGEREYAPLMDSLSKQQLAADNLVVLRVPQVYFLKSSSTEIFDQPLNDEGEGYVLRDGQIYPVEWVHDAPDRLVRLLLPNGRSFPLKPGNTWFEIVGVSSVFESLGDGAWNFDFGIP